MDSIQITAEKREEKEVPAKVRKAGFMPAVMYGNKSESTSLKLKQGEFEKVLRKAGKSTLVELSVDGGNHTVLIHDVQHHYLTGQPIHADFLTVNMKEKLTATVALEYVGESNAVKALGGTLAKVLSEIEVECLPKDLPAKLEVDISTLNTFEDSILVKDIKLPAGVEFVGDVEETVAKVDAPRDVEAEMAKEIGDVSAVEGIAEAPAAEGEASEETKADKAE